MRERFDPNEYIIVSALCGGYGDKDSHLARSYYSYVGKKT